jgi:hypothetical protein
VKDKSTEWKLINRRIQKVKCNLGHYVYLAFGAA